MATKNKETRESTFGKEMGDKRLPPQFRNSRNFQIPPNFREFRDFGTFPPRAGGVLKDAGRRGVGCGGSRLAPGRARLWGVNCARASDFGRRELAPRIPKAPPAPGLLDIIGIPEISKSRRISENFAISDLAHRNGRLSPGFRAPGARMRGVATGASPGRDWGGRWRESFDFLGSGTGPADPRCPPPSPRAIF